VGSIPNEVIESPPPPQCTCAFPESTLPQTEMSTGNIPGSKLWSRHKADNLTAICELVQKVWKPQCVTTQRDSTACYRDSFILCKSWCVLRMTHVHTRAREGKWHKHNWTMKNGWHLLGLRHVALLRADVSEELVHRFLSPWWWRSQVPPKRRFLQEPDGRRHHSS
jgi:hypothetical protein